MYKLGSRLPFNEKTPTKIDLGDGIELTLTLRGAGQILAFFDIKWEQEGFPDQKGEMFVSFGNHSDIPTFESMRQQFELVVERKVRQGLAFGRVRLKS